MVCGGSGCVLQLVSAVEVEVEVMVDATCNLRERAASTELCVHSQIEGGQDDDDERSQVDCDSESEPAF